MILLNQEPQRKKNEIMDVPRFSYLFKLAVVVVVAAVAGFNPIK